MRWELSLPRRPSRFRHAAVTVMTGLVPVILVGPRSAEGKFFPAIRLRLEATSGYMVSLARDVDDRDKSGHDGRGLGNAPPFTC